MGRSAMKIRLGTVLLALCCLAGGGPATPSHAKDVSVSDGSGGAGGDTTTSGVPADVSGDLGGTPTSSVESVSSGSSGRGQLTPSQSDQIKARGAVERGEVRPLGWLLRRLKKSVPGDVVKVRLKRNQTRSWTYDVTVLNASGRYVQVSLNAATGAIISKVKR
jgi:hypothetical protein